MRIATLCAIGAALFACNAPLDPTSKAPNERRVQQAGSNNFLGFHDCTADWPAYPVSGTQCNQSLPQFTGPGGWVTLVGYIGDGSGAAMNFDSVPAGMNILLRLDVAGGQAFPHTTSDADYAAYGNAVVTWLRRSQGLGRVQHVQLGNEPDQYGQEYPAWDGPDGGVCEYLSWLYPGRKRVQYATPARYARMFRAVQDALGAAGLGHIKLVTAPHMPRFFHQDGGAVFLDATCRDYSVGDYLEAIARAGGRIGGVGLHLQGLPFDAPWCYQNTERVTGGQCDIYTTYDYADTARQTYEDLRRHLRDAQACTSASGNETSGDSVRSRSCSGGSVPALFISEIHPPPPWNGDATRWIRETVRGVRQYNALGRAPVRALTFYRLYPADGSFGDAWGAVTAGVQQAYQDMGSPVGSAPTTTVSSQPGSGAPATVTPVAGCHQHSNQNLACDGSQGLCPNPEIAAVGGVTSCLDHQGQNVKFHCVCYGGSLHWFFDECGASACQQMFGGGGDGSSAPAVAQPGSTCGSTGNCGGAGQLSVCCAMNLRDGPDGSRIGQVPPGSYAISGRSPDGVWVQISGAGVAGWVATALHPQVAPSCVTCR